MKTAKEWLSQNNYEDILKKISAVERSWKRKGIKTRRDWWEILAGNKNGTPRSVDGKKFPILCAARKRKGWGETHNCLSRNSNETIPLVIPQIRWEKCKTHSRIAGARDL